MISCDTVIIGAGPVGLFQVFELGLLGLGAHVIDSVPQAGGQCIELYPDKPIYDIPAVPACSGRELIERLQQQIRPFAPQFHLGHTVTTLERMQDGRFRLQTSGGLVFDAGAVIIAGGLVAAPGYVRAQGSRRALKVSIGRIPWAAGNSPMTQYMINNKLLEKRADSLIAMFYPPDLASVTAAVRMMADGAGVRLTGDLAERIARAAGLDVRLAQSEVTKLALYLDASPQAPRGADAEALDAVGARTEEDGFMPLVNAVLSGETGKLAGELHRMRELALNPVGVLLAVERRAAQLAVLSTRIGPRGDVAALLEEETRAKRVFFRDKRDLAVQLRRWNGRKLGRLGDKLMDMHRALMANNQSAELLLAQGLAEIARAASPRR